MITRVGMASANATTVTIPSGHNVGDLMIAFAFRDGSITAPSLPAGWTSVGTPTGSTSHSARFGYRWATSASETSGTWTNATGLVVAVYRGVNVVTSPLGNNAPSIGESGDVVYAQMLTGFVGKNLTTGKSWIAAFSGHVSVDTSLETAPTNLVNVTNSVNATCEVAGFDSNGSAVLTWANTTVVVGGTSDKWITLCMVLDPKTTVLNNYQQPSSKSAGVISVTEKIR